MNLKKLKLLSIIGIFILAFPIHFIYEIFPNNIFSIFFPVNESIWEHMKMLFTCFIIWSFIEYIIFQKFKILYHNFIISSFFSGIISIPIYLILYLPFYYTIGHNMIITLTMMFITIAIVEYISYIILKAKEIKYINLISLILIVITYIAFGYLTYFPIRNDLFYDHEENKYGVNIYILGN
jgi:hypothetical protein